MKEEQIAPGNWVLNPKTGEPTKIWDIKHNGQCKPMYFHGDTCGASYGFYAAEMEPIPLTPGVLRVCGFKQKGVTWYLGGLDLMPHPDRDVWFFSVNGARMTFFSYLHDLQIAVHVVRDEPLPINEDALREAVKGDGV